MQLPPAVVPILQAVIEHPILPRGLPLEFWRSENHRMWVDAFLELGAALHASDLYEDSLPEGYVLVCHLFDWEAQCQFSGWYAFENRAESIDRVTAAYRTVGLPGEAAALERAFAAWQASEGGQDETSDAYNETPSEFPVDLDRMEHLACFFVDNAESLFYSPAEA